MTDAEKVAKALRAKHRRVRDGWWELAEFVEAAEGCRRYTPDRELEYGEVKEGPAYDAALARLAQTLEVGR